MLNPILVFDIETIPDIAGIRRLHELDSSVSDHDVAEMAFQLRRQSNGNDFLPHYLQKVLVISCVLQDRDQFRVWSLGANGESEAEIIQRFLMVLRNIRRK